MIVKTTYTRSNKAAKAAIRYMQHRKGKEGKRVTRNLFGIDGLMGRFEAYRMIEEAERGSYFYRVIISPDPNKEDTYRDLPLRELTEKTIQGLEERFQMRVSYVGVEHADHAPHRHVHILAIVPSRLQVQELKLLRKEATEAALTQRRERDLAREQNARGKEGREWEQ